MVVHQREQYSDWGDSKWDDITVQDQAYPTQELAKRRAKHLNETGKGYATVHPVKLYQEPMPQPQPVYVMPSLPPSTVFTAEDPAVKLQVAYDAPRRVFRQPETLADAVSLTVRVAKFALRQLSRRSEFSDSRLTSSLVNAV